MFLGIQQQLFQEGLIWNILTVVLNTRATLGHPLLTHLKQRRHWGVRPANSSRDRVYFVHFYFPITSTQPRSLLYSAVGEELDGG